MPPAAWLRIPRADDAADAPPPFKSDPVGDDAAGRGARPIARTAPEPRPSRRNAKGSWLTVCILALAWIGSLPAAAAPERMWLDDLQRPGSVVLRWGPARCWPEQQEVLSSLRCLSMGGAEPFFVATQRPPERPWDLSGKFLKVWIRVDEMRQLAAFELRLSSDNFESNYFAFTLPLFGDLDFNFVQDATWAEYTVSFASARVEGKPDRKRINSIGWLVRDRGEGAVDVSIAGVATQPSPRAGALSITFDDGVEDQWLAAEILAEHRLRGTAYIIPRLIGSVGFLGLDQLHEMHDRFGWEIAGHHGTPLTEMTPRQLDRALLGVRRYLEAHGFESGAHHFAYPLGKIDRGDSLRIARRVFATGRLAGSGPETLPPADPHKLRVLNVLNTTPPDEIVKRAQQAIQEGAWLILMFHKLRAPATDALEYEPDQFRELARKLAAAGIRSETIQEVWERMPR